MSSTTAAANTDTSVTVITKPAKEDTVMSFMNDHAYLMSMMTTDSLLPSSMTFGGMFEGDSGLNADELTDIASLLAPHVSDDETGASSIVSVETSSPSSMGPHFTDVTDAAESPALPDILIKKCNTNDKASMTADTRKTQLKRLSPAKTKTAALSIKKAKLAAVVTSTEDDGKAKPTPNPLAKSSNIPIVPPTTTSLEVAASKPTPVSSTTDSTELASTTVSPTVSPTTVPNDHPATEEERAQQCRDRNRQHARNTRLRKKAYVEELKRHLQEMAEARDAALLEEAKKKRIVEQQREVRFQVMQDFLQLRGRNEGNPHRWGAIVEDCISMTIPMTPFQSMVPDATMSLSSTEAVPTEQILYGVTDIMADSTHFASFLQSLGNSASSESPARAVITPVTFEYKCDRANFLMDNNAAILNWTAQSSGAMLQGARRELALQGSMRAWFCTETNCLEKVALQFDTGVVQSQLLAL